MEAYQELSDRYTSVELWNASLFVHQGQVIKECTLCGLCGLTGFNKAAAEGRGQGTLSSFRKAMGNVLTVCSHSFNNAIGECLVWVPMMGFSCREQENITNSHTF